MVGRELLETLTTRGLTLVADGESLRVRGQLDEELRALIRERKAELLALLAPCEPETWPEAPGPEWDAETAELIRWYRGARLPSEPFRLTGSKWIADAFLFFAALDRDIAGGPETPRALYGALQEDLIRLRELFSEDAT